MIQINGASVTPYDIKSSQSISQKSEDGRAGRAGEFSEEISNIPLAPDYDPRSKGALETMNKGLEKVFRVDGIIVGAFFEGGMSIVKLGGETLNHSGALTQSEIQEMLEKKYGGRLQSEVFDSSDSLKLINFQRGDLFNDHDLRSGWKPQPVLSDIEFNKLINAML